MNTTKYDFYINVNEKNDARVIAFDFIVPNSKILDIGCATGQMGAILKEHKNCEMYGIEYDPENIQIAQERNVFEKIFQIDLNNFQASELEKYKNSFDYIVFGDVLEHLLHPENTLEQFKQFLKPGGKYIISLPNVAHATVKINLLTDNFIYEEVGILDKTHIKFYTHKTIPEFLANNNLAIEKFDYTVAHVKYHNSEKNLLKLPFGLRNFIFRDIYSYPLQYITLCTISELPKEELIKNNKICITAKNTKKELRRIRNSCFRKYIYLFFITQLKNLLSFKKFD